MRMRNLRELGGVGDGVTDCTAAFAAAAHQLQTPSTRRSTARCRKGHLRVMKPHAIARGPDFH